MSSSLYKWVMSTSIALFTLLLICSGQIWAQGSGPAFVSPVGITIGLDSNWYVVDEGSDTVLRVVSDSGQRTVISSRNIGLGPALSRPVAIARAQNSEELLVADRNLRAILGVNPNNGNRRLISGCPVSSDPCPVIPQGLGPPFGDPVALTAADGSSSIFVVDDDRKALIRVNTLTGNRTTLSSSTMGSGPDFETLVGVAITNFGNVFALDQILDALVRVNLINGERGIASGCPTAEDPCPEPIVGSGINFDRPTSIAFQREPNLVVTDADLGAILSVNPNTGDRAILSDASLGTGPVFLNPMAIVVEANGTLVVVDESRKAIMSVDPVTGDREIVSRATDLIISPPTGIYTSKQNFDLALITNREGDFTLSFKVADVEVADQIRDCGDRAPLNSGGTIISCPNIVSFLNLLPGRHRIRAAITFPSGQTSPMNETTIVTRGEWDIVE